MIEIVYKGDTQERNGKENDFCLPKNIRQIGENKGGRKIYVEDYVSTFLKRLGEEKKTGNVAILMGKYHFRDDVSYLFIQSAFAIRQMEVEKEHISFTEGVWDEVHHTIEQYFAEQEILGWVLHIPGATLELTDLIQKTHLNHFAGNDKVLLMMEPTEKEETFYYYENGSMKKEVGYYIYYEKNEPMREYLIAYGNNQSIEELEKIPDRAVTNFRKVLEGKTKQRETQETKETSEKKRGTSSMRVLAACAAVAILAVGLNYAGSTGILPAFFEKQEAQGKNIQNKGETRNNTVETVTTVYPYTTVAAEPTTEPEITPKVKQSDEQKSETQTTDIRPATKEYIVKKGDTLSRICMVNYGSMEKLQEICQLNQLDNPELIFEGQKLVLPQ